MIQLTKKAEEMTNEELAWYIDDAILDPSLTEAQVRTSIREGIGLRCRSVCVNPRYLQMAVSLTEGTDTVACVVCDFPFGQGTTQARVAAAVDYCEKGAAEIDIVAPYGDIIAGHTDDVREDLRAVAEVCHERGVVLKVIIETDALTSEQIEAATVCVADAGADYVKSSTGFFNGTKQGATPEVVALMLKAAKERCLVKGSGGIRTKERMQELINLGVDRIGAGHGSVVKLLG